MDEISKQLPAEQFIRCHKSFIVNASCITELGENCFRLPQGLIGISKKHRKSAREQYYAYLFSHMGREKA